MLALWREEAELRTEWEFQAVTFQPPYTWDEGTYLGFHQLPLHRT